MVRLVSYGWYGGGIRFVFGAYLGGSPGAFVDSGVEAVVPPLPALITVTSSNCFGNFAPSCAVHLDCFSKLFVLFAHPRPLPDGVRDAVVPPLPAVLIVASREVCGDFVPTDRSVF